MEKSKAGADHKIRRENEKYLYAIFNIVTARKCYSEACTKTLEDILKLKRENQKPHIKMKETVLPEPPNLSLKEYFTTPEDFSSPAGHYSNNTEKISDNVFKELNELIKFVDETKESDIEIIKSQMSIDTE